MEDEQLHSHFSKSVSAGLFMGIIATLLSLCYNVFYREAASFDMIPIISVSSIIFIIPLVLMAAGIVYYYLSRNKTGRILYVVLAIVITLLCILLDFRIHRSPNPVLTAEFRKLLLGIIIISGLSSFLIPYLVNHKTNVV